MPPQLPTLWGYLLLPILVACSGPADAPDPAAAASLPIDIIEPRETVGSATAPQLVDPDAGPELVVAVAPRLMNLLALLEVGSQRTATAARRDHLELRRRELREIYNEFTELGRNLDFAVPTEIPNRIYAGTERLRATPEREFSEELDDALDGEISALLVIMEPYRTRKLGLDFGPLFRRLEAALQLIER